MSDSTDVWFPTKIKFPEECSGLLNHQDNTIYPNHCNPFHSKFCKSMNKHWLRLSILQKLSNAYNPEAENHQFPENHYNHGFKIDYRSHLYLHFPALQKICAITLFSLIEPSPPSPFSLTCYPLYITTKREIVFLITLLLKIQDNNLSNVVLTSPLCPLASLGALFALSRPHVTSALRYESWLR